MDHAGQQETELQTQIRYSTESYFWYSVLLDVRQLSLESPTLQVPIILPAMDTPYRRIVTGHSPGGKAIIHSDTTLAPVSLYDPSKPPSNDHAGCINIHRSEGFPANNNVPFTELHGTPIPLVDPIRTSIRIIDMPPGTSSPLHRTVSLDFGVVLKGEVVLELDDGVETTVKEQSTVVQRGTIHAWHNRTKEVSRMLFVLLPAEKVRVERTGEELGGEGIPTDGLAA
jgi:quercetin dioxygenase-like cupin family protein